MKAPLEAAAGRSTAPADDADLSQLYAACDAQHLAPLWREIGDLMPRRPTPRARAHHWVWSQLYDIAAQAGQLVPVGRGGERRAIALANPGLGGRPYATPTLWAAIQYLGVGENAPEHRHSQNAFRFVLEGEGVWTVVDGDSVAMRRGDLLLTAGWRFHGHHNATDRPMAWLDGLDIPFAHQIDAGFFETGAAVTPVRDTPDRSISERLWGHPGLVPIRRAADSTGSPLMAYRWEDTDRALDDQLSLEDAGHQVTVEPGHAAIVYASPLGGDILPTIRAEFHRVRAGVRTRARREVGSSVWQIFHGTGHVRIGDVTYALAAGDLFVVPSWQWVTVEADAQLELFRFSDAPIFEALGFARSEIDDDGTQCQ